MRTATARAHSLNRHTTGNNMPTKALAKALHTLTSVTNVAQYLVTKEKHTSGAELARRALMVINPGYDYSVAELLRFQKAKKRSLELVQNEDKAGEIPLLIARIVDVCDDILAKQQDASAK